MAYRSNRTWPALALIAFGLHFVWAGAFAYLFWAEPSASVCATVAELTGAAVGDSATCQFFERSVASARVASAMDRLDILGVALSAIAAVLAVAGLGGFFMVRQHAVAAAEDEARRIMDIMAEPAVDAYLDAHGDSLIAVWVQRNPWAIRDAVDSLERGEAEISDDAAEQIAQGISDEDAP